MMYQDGEFMTRRFQQNDLAVQLRLRQSRQSFAAMVITEWHKLIADVSQPFACRRIRRAAAKRRQTLARVRPSPASKHKPPD
jgi:hypothetical protein